MSSPPTTDPHSAEASSGRPLVEVGDAVLDQQRHDQVRRALGRGEHCGSTSRAHCRRRSRSGWWSIRWRPRWTSALFALGVVLLTAFARHQRGRRDPLVEPALFGGRPFPASLAGSLLFVLAAIGLVIAVLALAVPMPARRRTELDSRV